MVRLLLGVFGKRNVLRLNIDDVQASLTGRREISMRHLILEVLRFPLSLGVLGSCRFVHLFCNQLLKHIVSVIVPASFRLLMLVLERGDALITFGA